MGCGCDVMCDVVWCVCFGVVLVRGCVNVFVCAVCELLCAVLWFGVCAVSCLCVFVFICV